MGGILLELAMRHGAPLLQNLGAFGLEHLKDRIGRPKGGAEQDTHRHQVQLSVPDLQGALQQMGVSLPAAIPDVRASAAALRQQVGLPSLQMPPRSVTQAAPAISSLDSHAPSSVADSYAAEIEDPSVACRPCTMRHLTTMHEAAKEAAASADDGLRRQHAALVAAEALIWLEYDATPESLARSKPDDAAVVGAMVGPVRGLLSAVPHAPDRVLLAWGAILECQRFAESRRPGPRDGEHISRRIADAFGWIGYLESNDRRALGDQVNALRAARHPLAQDGPTPAALAIAEEQLRAAATSLQPALSLEEARDLAARTAAIRRDFFARAMDSLRPPATAEGRWYKDRDTRLPAELRAALQAGREPQASPVPPAPASDVPVGGLLGATPQTVAAFTHLLEFDRAIGVTVRDRQLPADWDSVLKGAYNPDGHWMVLNPAIVAEDPDALNTVTHESAHALLHGGRCLLHRTPSDQYADEYEDTVEEREANLTQLLAFTLSDLPLEYDDGQVVPPAQWHVDLDALRRDLDALTFSRVTWAAGVLAEAMRTGAAAAPLAAACPVR